ncbi:MAG: response regulator transcription factor [Deltaproteobacteria bacterium]|nr:response regulator transcription factor [Deltaproteobacteria bacterium]MBW2533343.1 response regulator transcription factor [Deltaproteobacteria bacterium]
MARILVVDDEARIRDVVQYALEREGFEVTLARDGAEALERVAEGGLDLVVLDILMPELDGLSTARKIREQGSLPIIFLSSRAEEVDRILGLELGGDDYVVKPFSPRELAIRVKTVLRRTAGEGADARGASPILRHGPLQMDLPRHQVRVGEDKVELTVTEFEMLRALIERPGLVLSRPQLIDRAYQDETCITERTVDTHIRRIRAKLRPLGHDPIETVHGVGYKASEPS